MVRTYPDGGQPGTPPWRTREGMWTSGARRWMKARRTWVERGRPKPA